MLLPSLARESWFPLIFNQDHLLIIGVVRRPQLQVPRHRRQVVRRRRLGPRVGRCLGLLGSRFVDQDPGLCYRCR